MEKCLHLTKILPIVFSTIQWQKVKIWRSHTAQPSLKLLSLNLTICKA